MRGFFRLPRLFVYFTPSVDVWEVGVMGDVGRLGDCLTRRGHGGGRVNFIPAVKTLRSKRLDLIRHYIGRGSIYMIDIFIGPARFGSGRSLRACPHALSGSYALLRPINYSCMFTPSTRRVCPRPSAHAFSFNAISTMVRKTHHPKRFGKITRVIDGLFCMIRPSGTCFNRGSFRRVTIVHTVIGRLSVPIGVGSYPVLHRTSNLTLDDHGIHLAPRRHRGTPLVTHALGRDAGFIPRGDIRRIVSCIIGAVGTSPVVHIRCCRVMSNGAVRSVGG